jgi:DNA-binding transcriptional LysR family regulator
MDKISCMKLFVRVAEAGGFAKAATRESVSPAVVSRAVMELEASLKTRLFNRTTRQVSLTEAGHRYLQHCEKILKQVELADAEAMGFSTLPNGTLRVHATASFGQHYVTPLLARYIQRFEDVLVDLVLAQRTPDLVDERFDVAIVLAQSLKDSSLVAQQIGASRQVLCAEPGYLARHGHPANISDLERHTIVQLTLHEMPTSPWIFDNSERSLFEPLTSARLMVNIPEALGEAIRAGMGIGMLPIPTALQGMRDGSLVEVLPKQRLQPNNVYALYASRHFLDAKIKTLIEFLRNEVPRRVAEHERELETYSARQDLMV